MTSIDGGDTWSTVKDYGLLLAKRVAIAGDNKQALYIFGSSTMEYSGNFGTTIDSRWGNLSDLGSPGEFIGVAGG